MVKDVFEVAHFKITFKGLLRDGGGAHVKLSYDVALHDLYGEIIAQKIKEVQSLFKRGFAELEIAGSIILSCYTERWNDKQNNMVFCRQLKKICV